MDRSTTRRFQEGVGIVQGRVGAGDGPETRSIAGVLPPVEIVFRPSGSETLPPSRPIGFRRLGFQLHQFLDGRSVGYRDVGSPATIAALDDPPGDREAFPGIVRSPKLTDPQV